MPAAETGKPLPKDNRLIIPKIDLDQHIFEGTSPYTVNKGVWIRPNASRPDIGSNTVMVAHRLTYTDPRGPFYFLNKLAVGDEIAVTWQQKVYHYKVESIKVVSPTDVEVEAPTKQSVLTLYTCTPLWTLSSRLVIRAGLEQAS